ncbi:33098_t:CDS:2, partial [Racocetra persica]
ENDENLEEWPECDNCYGQNKEFCANRKMIEIFFSHVVIQIEDSIQDVGNKILKKRKSKHDKKYKARLNTSKRNQPIKKFAKKKKFNHDVRSKTKK